MSSEEKKEKDKSEIDYEKLVWQQLLTVGSHPITQARVLVQLGYEPAPAFYRASGIPVLSSAGYFYKGIFTGYLRDANLFPFNVDTFFVGMTYKVVETTVSSITQTLAENPIRSLIPSKVDDESFEGVLTNSTKEFLIKAVGVVASRPFYVIAIRQIATIAEGSNDTAILAPLKQILSDGGLFAGLLPKLSYEAAVIFTYNTLIYLYNNNVKGEEDENMFIHKSLPPIINMAVTTVWYPIHLVSTVMCVNGSGLVLDEFPELGWVTVLRNLRSKKLHNRGHSMLFSRKAPRAIEGTPV